MLLGRLLAKVVVSISREEGRSENGRGLGPEKRPSPAENIYQTIGRGPVINLTYLTL